MFFASVARQQKIERMCVGFQSPIFCPIVQGHQLSRILSAVFRFGKTLGQNSMSTAQTEMSFFPTTFGFHILRHFFTTLFDTFGFAHAPDISKW